MLHPPPHTESNNWTVSLRSDSEILYVQQPTGDLIAAQVALTRRRAVIQARLLLKGPT
jgi:hypothetical protein